MLSRNVEQETLEQETFRKRLGTGNAQETLNRKRSGNVGNRKRSGNVGEEKKQETQETLKSFPVSH